MYEKVNDTRHGFAFDCISQQLFTSLSYWGGRWAELVGAVYCCTVNDRITELGTSIVNDGDEFEVTEQTGDTLVDAKIDISEMWINIDYSENTWSSAGDFNGYIFDFSPINPNDPFPEIESITLNELEMTIDAALSFDADTIRISLPS